MNNTGIFCSSVSVFEAMAAYDTAFPFSVVCASSFSPFCPHGSILVSHRCLSSIHPLPSSCPNPPKWHSSAAFCSLFWAHAPVHWFLQPTGWWLTHPPRRVTWPAGSPMMLSLDVSPIPVLRSGNFPSLQCPLDWQKPSQFHPECRRNSDLVVWHLPLHLPPHFLTNEQPGFILLCTLWMSPGTCPLLSACILLPGFRSHPSLRGPCANFQLFSPCLWS